VIDRVETAMIKRVLGPRAYRIPVTSIKGATGNPMAAAGALELATCALIMQQELVPPTTNYTTPDPHCDLDYVPARPRRLVVRRALVNVHGLGGINSALAVANGAA
jgi:3-oxoacyl-(acyl-carrier-protein) synthase